MDDSFKYHGMSNDQIGFNTFPWDVRDRIVAVEVLAIHG